MWSLSDQIYGAFQNPDEITSLFEYTTQNTSEGYERMETCYEKGKRRIEELLAQEIYSTKKILLKGEDFKIC